MSLVRLEWIDVDNSKLYFSRVRLRGAGHLIHHAMWFKHLNLNEAENRRFVHWIINRYTSELCLNYLYQWLQIAKAGSEKIRVPSLSDVRKNVFANEHKSVEGGGEIP